MRIQHDTGQKMKFVRGDEEYARQWDRYSGTAQFIENKIALTSPPGAAGMLYLKNSAGHGDLNISAKLEGNVIGKQTIYVRYDRLKDSFIRIVLHDNKLTVEQKQPKGEVKELFTTKLSDVQWNPLDLSFDRASVYTREQGESGAPKMEEYPINIQNTRQRTESGWYVCWLCWQGALHLGEVTPRRRTMTTQPLPKKWFATKGK